MLFSVSVWCLATTALFLVLFFPAVMAGETGISNKKEKRKEALLLKKACMVTFFAKKTGRNILGKHISQAQ